MTVFGTHRSSVGGAAVLALCTVALVSGCTPKQAQSTQQERAAFSADPNRMPPEARQRMMEAQRGRPGGVTYAAPPAAPR